ncbi:UvrB/UvrC motif-containing protein [Fontisphaera persica]|uniref:UvrB/UvrC motif-containing protein n=1 Tax=Fontisphaera persica TaxID=2974023 RepID=UPI0024C0C268|nr:UvrB/UvrC motif-containing protein [Fontisphaera persica]WCJ60335.1 UvrB/UvrC motif-containing protein [Fontisphaera persica]
MQKLDLCEDCAREHKVDAPTNFKLADMLLGLGAADEVGEAASTELVCPQCGYTQAHFKKLGRMGCAACYQVFGPALEDMLRTMHRGVRHVGKVPRRLQGPAQPPVDVTEQIRQLNERLERAVAQEDYELAAQLRDEIKSLKAKAGGRKVKE